MQLVAIIVIVGLAVAAVAVWLWVARLGRRPQPVIKTAPGGGVDLARVQAEAARSLARSIQSASELFNKNLTVQALKINDELEGIARQRLRQQVTDFTAVLGDLTSTATASVGQLEALVEQRRAALEAAMATEIQGEKQRTLDQFYHRLDDIVASYITESLGSSIDLSSQLPFVIEVLNQNRDLIKQDVLSDY